MSPPKSAWPRTCCILSLILAVSSFRCTSGDPASPPIQPEPKLSDLLAPSVLFNVSERKHRVAVRVEDDQGVQTIAEVQYSILDPSGATRVGGNLVDDGTAGDIIPRDGQFSTQLDGRFAGSDTGAFELRVVAEDQDGNRSNQLTTTIRVLPGTGNLPPEVVETFTPERVAVDSSFDLVVAARVNDADGLEDVANVRLQFFPPTYPTPTHEVDLMDDGTAGDTTAGDGIYSGLLSSGLFEQPNEHFLRFQAEDRAGNRSPAVVVPIRGFFAGNRPPVISNVVAPDTVKINPNAVTEILITVDVTDPQGLSDIDFVRFRSFLPSGEEAQNSPTELADDGDSERTGDAVAGDGTYSRIVILPSSGVPTGDFRFEFQAGDKSGALSNIINHILTVIE